MCELNQSAKRRKSQDGESSRMKASTDGMTTDIGLWRLDELVRLEPSTSHVNGAFIGETSFGIELLPQEELVGNAIVCQRSINYPS